MKLLITKFIVAKAAFWTNVAVAAVYLLSAYAGHVDPRLFGYVPILGLAYPVMLCLLLAFVAVWAFLGWRRLWVSAASLALTLPQVLAFCPLNFGEKKHNFRLMTYNTFQLATDGKTTVFDEILKYEPDFVCLQESPNVSAFKNHISSPGQLDELKKAYPYMVSDRASSLSVMSKTPVRIIKEYSNFDSYCYAICRTTVKGTTLFVINTHLESIKLTPSDKKIYMQLTSPSEKKSIEGVRTQLLGKLNHAFKNRADQAEELRQMADSLQTAHPDAEIMICGDFNDTPHSYAYLTVRGDFSDAYCDGGTGPVITYNLNRFYFHIDQILYSGGRFEAVRCRRGTSRVSDHYPVIADFRIDEKTKQHK